MSNQKIIDYAVTFGIVFVMFQIGGWLGWSFPVILVVSLAIIAAYGFGRQIWLRWRFGWSQRYNTLVARVQAGDFETVHEELVQRYGSGERCIEILAGLALIQPRLGRWREAERYADELRAYVEQRGLCARTDVSSRARCDLALYAQADVLIAQGRYADAANSLRPRVPDAAAPNYMTAIIATCYFLAADAYNAGVVLQHVKPVKKSEDYAAYITPEYQFMVAYMRHVLNGEDTRADLANLSDCFPRWEAEAARYTDSPYGERLSAILDDIRPLLPQMEV